ncbi:MAG TPA: GPW/gp25 family protein [Kofleriaceae bacterium]|nr:GPW/gp25 family protein [Kofleriaceae bacterium]
MAADKLLEIVGRGWRFPLAFDRGVLGAAMVATAQDEIDQSLSALFATRPGERIMRPDYGCDLRRFLFRGIDSTTAAEIKDTISMAILRHEPRITVNSIVVDGRDYLDGRLELHIDYTINTTNSRTNRVYPFYLQEATNLPLPR